MKIHRIIPCFLLLLAALTMSAAADEPDFRALWVSTVYNLDYPSQKGLSAQALQDEADALLDLAARCGLNAIVLQVRPCADSLYQSSLFPWSEYVSGTQGVAPDGGFDPLAYFIEAGHARGIEIHAWCNPYRVTRSASDTKEEALAKLAENHPARQRPELVCLHSDGCLYFDPGQPEARQLILDGMLEIVDNYDIDGLHLDDYFYPGSEFNDAETFARYGANFTDIGDFRRDAVTQFVTALYQSVKARNPDVQIGISPFGIWANQSTNPLGSNTIGSQSYYDHYADSYGWVKAGIVDYIAPQLYWPTGNREGEYAELLRWWCETVSGTDVDLYIGLAAYRLLEAEPDSPWYGTTEIESQISQLCASDASGFLLFRAGSVRDNPALTQLLARRFDTADEQSVHTLSVGRPADTVRTPLPGFFCTGTSDPSASLTVNGTEITARSESGYFGILLPLNPGKNTFVFVNGDMQETRTIYRLPVITLFANHYPSADSRLPADEITLSCTAPSGSQVSAWISDTVVALTDDGSGHYSAPLPQGTSPPEQEHILYTAEKHGFVRVAFSRGALSLLDEDEMIAFSVTSDNSDLCLTTDPQDGSDGFLLKGMTGLADGLNNGFLHLPNQGYLRLSDVDIVTPADIKSYNLTGITCTEDKELYTISFDCGGLPAVTCRFDEGKLCLTAQPIDLAFLFESPLFSDISLEQIQQTAIYTMTLRSDLVIDGYQIIPTDNGFALQLKKHLTSSGGLPLSGITVLLDAGHGGTALGALGADLNWPEKRVNLETALTLQSTLRQAGAEVIMTRNEDIDLSLRDRLSSALNQAPDVFISLHSNSAADNVDMTQCRGVSLYSKSTLAQPLAQCIATQLSSVGHNTELITDSNLYLCRAESSLSVLIENEFITNPYGMETLMSSIERNAFCGAVTQGIADYFAN